MRPIGCTLVWCVAVAILFCSSLGCGNSDRTRPSAQPKTNVEARHQALRLVDLDGNPFDLWQPGHATVTVVVFTRSDCPISNRFAPEIRRLYETYHPRGVDVYLVYIDPTEPPEDIRHHLEEYGYPCQALRDPEHSLVAHCQATTTPEAVVFSTDQVIVYQGRINDLYVKLGMARTEPTTHDLADAIEATLLGRTVATPRAKAIGCPIADLKY